VNESLQQRYRARYQAAKEHGVKFFPDIIYKDLIASFGVFLALLLLATFIGVSQEPPADPADTSYVPRPEWYFLWLFQLLKYFPGKLEWVGTTVVPIVLVLLLLLLPFYDRNPFRHWRRRRVAMSAMVLGVVGIVGLTVLAVASTPPSTETTAAATLSAQIVAGQDLFSINCAECHGSNGETTKIEGVTGLEGTAVVPLNSKDFIYTRTDDTIYNIIEQGQVDLGMTPFGTAYGGQLKRGDIESIVSFMRYTWDDRVPLPEEAAAASAIPTLAPNAVPTYKDQIEPIIRRNCVTCHRAGKQTNNYLMETYDEVLHSGDHAPNVVAGDLNSNLIRMIHREEITAGGPMPPSKALPPELVDTFERWVKAGMPP
jgi:mono/diheme cytochrome c family protein